MTETMRAPHTEYGADALIMCDNLVRIYQVENIEVQALQGLDLLVDKGEMIAIVGQSGSGKSTLLNVLSGLDVPTAGAARVAGWDLLRMNHGDRLTYRRSVVGFVWQQTARNLLPYLSARENVMLPMAFTGLGSRKRSHRATELLDAMGMADKAGRRPHQLSGGEQQRVAIAVALANSPEVIFADEPTGELDSSTGDDVFEALRAANRDLGATVVVVTHDHAVSSQVQRTVAIRDGRTATEVVRRTHVDDEGQTQTVHEEYAVLDRAGRLQLPRDYRDSLQLRDRVRLELESDHIGVWNDQTPKPVAPPVAPVVAVPTADTAEAELSAPDERAPDQDSADAAGSEVTDAASPEPPAVAPLPASEDANDAYAPPPARQPKVPHDYDVDAAYGDDVTPYAPAVLAQPAPEEDAESEDDTAPEPELPASLSPYLGSAAPAPAEPEAADPEAVDPPATPARLSPYMAPVSDTADAAPAASEAAPPEAAGEDSDAHGDNSSSPAGEDDEDPATASATPAKPATTQPAAAPETGELRMPWLPVKEARDD